MNCKNCGGPITDNDKFCKHCGAKNEQANQNNKYYTSQITFDQVNTGNSSYNYMPGAKSRIIAGVLALLTTFGIYNFYLGYKKKAIAQLIISIIASVFALFMNLTLINYGEVVLYYLLGAGYLIFGLTVGIWSLVDAIRLFTRNINVDGKGNPLI